MPRPTAGVVAALLGVWCLSLPAVHLADRYSLSGDGHIVRTGEADSDGIVDGGLDDPSRFFYGCIDCAPGGVGSGGRAGAAHARTRTGTRARARTNTAPDLSSENDSDVGDAVDASAGSSTPHQSAIYSLASSSPGDIFILSPDGHLLERLHNGHSWAYVVHPRPQSSVPLVALTTVPLLEDRDSALQHIGSVYASDAEGRLYQAVQVRLFNRRFANATGAVPLLWEDVSYEDYRIFTGGVVGGISTVNPNDEQQLVYFVDSDGRLLSRCVDDDFRTDRIRRIMQMIQKGDAAAAAVGGALGDAAVDPLANAGSLAHVPSSSSRGQWRSHGSPPGAGLAVVAAVLRQAPHSVFAITTEGDLAEYRQGTWHAHPRPRPGVRLSLLPGALMFQHRTSWGRGENPTLQNGIGVMLIDADGSIWNRIGTIGEDLQWERQRRGPGRFVSAPSSKLMLPHMVSTFIVAEDGLLYERRFRAMSNRWSWAQHGHPKGSLLSSARPLVVSSTIIVCHTIDGQLALRQRWYNQWEWVVRPLPTSHHGVSLEDLVQLHPFAAHQAAQARGDLETLRLKLHPDLCSWDPDAPNTCGIRRSPMSQIGLPAQLCNLEGFLATGHQISRMAQPEVTQAFLKSGLVAYFDADQRMAVHSLSKELTQVGFGDAGANLHDPNSSYIALKSISLLPSASKKQHLLDRLKQNPRTYLPGASFFLGELLSTSAFSLTPGGSVFERFYNGITWVYVRHESPGPRPLLAVTTVATHGTIFVSDERGQVYQRISPGVDRPLAWKKVFVRHRIFSGGITGSQTAHGVRVFFINDKNTIVAYSVHQRNWTEYEGNNDDLIESELNIGTLFTTHNTEDDEPTSAPGTDGAEVGSADAAADATPGSDADADAALKKEFSAVEVTPEDVADPHTNILPESSQLDPAVKSIIDVFGLPKDLGAANKNDEYRAVPTVLIDAYTLDPASLFAIDAHGQLIEHSTIDRVWVNHGFPCRGCRLSLARGVILRDTHPKRVGSLFLRTEHGTLVERWWDSNAVGWRWMDHGTPEGVFLASAPGALHESREMYAVCSDGHLWARAFLGDSWKWVDRGMPSVPLAVMSPIKVGGNEVLAVTLDGHIATIKADARVDGRQRGFAEYTIPEPVYMGDPPLSMYCSDDAMSRWNCIQGYAAGEDGTARNDRFQSKLASVFDTSGQTGAEQQQQQRSQGKKRRKTKKRRQFHKFSEDAARAGAGSSEGGWLGWLRL